MIATDPRLKNVLKELKRRPQHPVGEYVNEAIKLHSSLPDAKPYGKSLANTRLQMNAIRSRIVHLKMLCLRECLYLRGVEKKLRKHLYARYANFLQSMKNREYRDATVSEALSPLTSRIEKLASAVEIFDVALADFDSRAFSIRDTVNALNLADRE